MREIDFMDMLLLFLALRYGVDFIKHITNNKRRLK